MKILKLILASIVFSFMLSGCSMCFDKKHDLTIVIPTPTKEVVTPSQESAKGVSKSADQAKVSIEKARDVIVKAPATETSKQSLPFIDDAYKYVSDVIAFAKELEIQLNGLSMQLTTCKQAYDNEIRKVVAASNAQAKIELDAKDKDISKLNGDIVLLKKDLKKANDDREATEKILSSTVARSWSYLSWLGMAMLVGGIIGIGICAYLNMGKKIVAIIAGCGFACMIAASIMPRILVTSTTAFKWIVLTAAGSIAALIILAVVMFVIHGNLHELIDKWTDKIGKDKDPRLLSKEEKDKLYVPVDKTKVI